MLRGRWECDVPAVCGAEMDCADEEHARGARDAGWQARALEAAADRGSLRTTEVTGSRALPLMRRVVSAFRDEREFRGLPGGEAAGELGEAGEALVREDAGGGGGAIAAGAVDGDAAIARKLGQALFQMIERDVDAVGDVLGGVLARGADVEDEWSAGSVELFGERDGVEAIGGGDEIGASGECGEAVGEIAADVVEADAAEAECGLVLAAGLGEDDDGACRDRAASRPRWRTGRRGRC